MANEITANVKFPWGGVGPKTFLQAAVHTYTTASNSGIVLGSAVCVVNGNAVLARANASGTLATGLVSKVISTTRCEVMTDGVFNLPIALGTYDDGTDLYLSSVTAGALLTTVPDDVSHFVQYIGKCLYTDTTTRVELRVAGMSDVTSSGAYRLLEKVYMSGGSLWSESNPGVWGTVAGASFVGKRAGLQATQNIAQLSFKFTTDVDAPSTGTEVASLLVKKINGSWVASQDASIKVRAAGVGTVCLTLGTTDYVTVSRELVSEDPDVYAATTTVTGDLVVTAGETTLGPSTVDGTLAVTGATNIGGGYGATGVTISAAGNIQADGTLTVDDAVELNSTLTVDGVTTINDTLNVNGEVVADALTVSGATSLLNTVAITSDATVTNGLLTSKKAAAPGKVKLVRYETDGNLVAANEIGAVEFYGTESQVGTYSSGNFTAAVRCISEHDDWVTTTGVRHSKLCFNLWDAFNATPAAETTVLTVALDGVGSYIQVDGAGTFLGPVTATNFPAFTGAHIYPVSGVAPAGAALVLNAQEVSLASTPRAKNCVGIAIETYLGTKSSFGEAPEAQLVKVAAVGDNFSGDLRGFLVCNENGPIAAGDLLCTSSVPGHLMKQDDDILRAYTVGKAMQDVVFDDSGKASGVYGYIYCG